LLVAIANDGNNWLASFASVTAENNDKWEWFLLVVRTKVISPQREVYVISNRYKGILIAVEVGILGPALCTINVA
jgi:hypothetical protein